VPSGTRQNLDARDEWFCHGVNFDIIRFDDVLVFVVDEVEAIAFVDRQVPAPDPDHQIISQPQELHLFSWFRLTLGLEQIQRSH